ncbi:DUF6227 family protein [Streptomyces sp. LP05-1]|uniref:DUF6227 family protein n=1 Tax=Streptomyces pyxinae TaxID=2970734 RepID=A0ABT2CPK2_9ACTN|nr:DUF6227 family protein [Streptomyces sp. LP05-1]
MNSFDLPDSLVERLDSALAHASSLHSSHHSASLHRSTYRHTYLLADGSSVTLWELVHNHGRDGSSHHELYAEEAGARLAASRLAAEHDPSGPFEPAGSAPDWGLETPDLADLAGFTDLADLELLRLFPAAGTTLPPLPREYPQGDSADHARRVLRRAENADRPGPEVAARLRGAFAHDIRQVFGRQCSVAGRRAGFTLYEHGFLLLDGDELSLWEVEHTATADGRHMCEVYESEHTARAAMRLRARVR